MTGASPRRSSQARIPVSAVIITLNEAKVIARCLTSLRDLVAEVVVVDSGSTDGTREIAERHGAVTTQVEWRGYAGQRQVGIDRASHDWILVVDADEVVSPDLARSLRRLFAHGTPAAERAFGVDRPKDFLGVVMTSPARRRNIVEEVRLFNRQTAGYDLDVTVHERIQHVGRATLLDGPLLHLQGLDFAGELEKMNHYSSLEADARIETGGGSSVLRLLARPAARFTWVYVCRGWARHGWRGLAHACLRAFWEMSTEVKVMARQKTVSTSDTRELR